MLVDWAPDDQDSPGVGLFDARTGRALSWPVPSSDIPDLLRALALQGVPHQGSGQAEIPGKVLAAAVSAGLIVPCPPCDQTFPTSCTPHQQAAHREACMVPPDAESLPRPPPAARLRRPASGTRTPLPDRPAPPSRPLSAVLDERRSRRVFAEQSVPLPLLGALLGRAARVRGFLPPLDLQQTQRPAPSGGGRHSLEIYVLARDVTGLAPGAHHYDPFDHTLERLAPWGQELSELMDRLITRPGRMSRTPPVALYLASYTERTSWKYGGMTLSLVYRDTGCLLQTLCLVATDTGLAACPIGAIDAPVTASFLNDTDGQVMHVGGFALGLPSDVPPPSVTPPHLAKGAGRHQPPPH